MEGEVKTEKSTSRCIFQRDPFRIQPGRSLRKFPPKTPVSFRFPSRRRRYRCQK